jgi:hypothetical protein
VIHRPRSGSRSTIRSRVGRRGDVPGPACKNARGGSRGITAHSGEHTERRELRAQGSRVSVRLVHIPGPRRPPPRRRGQRRPRRGRRRACADLVGGLKGDYHTNDALRKPQLFGTFRGKRKDYKCRSGSEIASTETDKSDESMR